MPPVPLRCLYSMYRRHHTRIQATIIGRLVYALPGIAEYLSSGGSSQGCFGQALGAAN